MLPFEERYSSCCTIAKLTNFQICVCTIVRLHHQPVINSGMVSFIFPNEAMAGKELSLSKRNI
jgi:hypothetical protein